MVLQPITAERPGSTHCCPPTSSPTAPSSMMSMNVPRWVDGRVGRLRGALSADFLYRFEGFPALQEGPSGSGANPPLRVTTDGTVSREAAF